MIRLIEILIDDQSWLPGTVPSAIATLQGKRNTNVLHALIHTALWTRPPKIYGIHLSDLWAWIRYYSAIANSPDLRLCKEWETIDPHQKTILSDELSIGFTTQLLIEKLGCLHFADTLHVVNVLHPGKFFLKPSTKTGLQKSPDYIGYDSSSNYYVLECKGTQTSRKSLKKAIEQGKKQKANLGTNKATKIKYSLVAGLFIPQWSSREKSCIHIADPSWEELDRLVAEDSTERVNTAIVQVALAKHLSLIGLTRTSRVLAETPTDELDRLPDEALSELDGWLETQSQEPRTLFDTADIRSRLPISLPDLPRGRFIVQTPENLLRQLRDSEAVGNFLTELSIPSENNVWPLVEASERSAEVMSPLGFRFSLEFLSENVEV